MQRAYYSATGDQFFEDDLMTILGELTRHHSFALDDLQKNSWISQINILKEVLTFLTDFFYIAFEYSIPRMGKRVDVVILYRGLVFVVEFKVGEKAYSRAAIEQVLDYSVDLKNFHEESHHCEIVPVAACTDAPSESIHMDVYPDNVWVPVHANKHNLGQLIESIAVKRGLQATNPSVWMNSIYKPTPTIIEAAQALYKGHSVEEISRSDSGAINLGRTSAAISDIIELSKSEHRKSICFITGVPGAGKTLAGLNIANVRHNADEGEHAVFLSGNGPLVDVLQEALARNEVAEAMLKGDKINKAVALRKSKAFIQNIHHFRDDNLQTDRAPIEKVVIFDEAQRAWTSQQAASFMSKKRGVRDFDMSEPEFLISVMDRHEDWATIVCLIGGGQEINTGEAGLPEWFNAIQRKYPHWDVYASDMLTDQEYTHGSELYSIIDQKQLNIRKNLHLSVSVRSFRSEKLSEFIKAVLSLDAESGVELFQELQSSYPIVLTRDLQVAKQWLKAQARGGESYGLTAYSGGYRLKPEGIHVKSAIDPKTWFLNGREDVRSASFLEDAATEFDIQGLELDWTCIAWDPSLRMRMGAWEYKSFRGTKWQNINDPLRRRYLLNAYRVLLTRARQGMVVFIPQGDSEDATRLPEYYDPVCSYFEAFGVPLI
ncbi:DUF2075 domain-containing protein [uncultured Pseudodesulfovibrio sp.]|uniref:DUF2075 domain-containing protein n=1 Tax=uncultured Pseudodesulfovibrio sp. TaxID=2035858 RepID=UPI0029C7DA7B|nr:DUF2075 domain-containing protein [uncultured Pseudodesulfovibrio sp.]